MRNISSRFFTMKELEIGKTKGTSYIKTLILSTRGMAFPVVEFSREGYKIRKVFG